MPATGSTQSIRRRRMIPRVQDFRFADYVRAAGAEGAVLRHALPGVGNLQALYLEAAWLEVEHWFPITNDAATMYDAFGVFHPAKTSNLYAPDTFTALAVRADELRAEPAFARAFALGSFPNYWHVLVDFIPRLAHVFASGTAGLPLLVGPTCPPIQREIVNAIYAMQGLPLPEVIVLPAGIVAVRRVIFPFRPSLRMALNFWDALLPRNESRKADSLIFVRRGAVARRRLLNEDAVAERLACRGFTGIDPGALSFAEQVEAFRTARCVVGAHGAALTNIMFASDGGALVELLAGFEQPFFKSLAAEKKWRRVVVRDVATPADASHHTDFTIDIDALDRALDEALA
jgi:capsular polysaccharide biosynthesis protein